MLWAIEDWSFVALDIEAVSNTKSHGKYVEQWRAEYMRPVLRKVLVLNTKDGASYARRCEWRRVDIAAGGKCSGADAEWPKCQQFPRCRALGSMAAGRVN